MKKLFFFSVLCLLSLMVVSAYNLPGEEVEFGCASTMETSDLTFSDGYGEYIHCSYNMVVNGEQEDFGFFPLAWANPEGQPDGTNFWNQTHYCGRCDGEGNPIPYNLTNGTTTWNAIITKTPVYYNETLDSWVLGEIEVLDQLEQEFKTIPEPDQGFIQALIQAIVGVICGIFPDFGFCTI